MKEDTGFMSMGTSKEDHEASNGIVNRLFWYGIADMPTTEILQSSPPYVCRRKHEDIGQREDPLKKQRYLIGIHKLQSLRLWVLLKENHEASNGVVNRLFGYGIADMPTTEILQSSQHMHVAGT
ncbi:hypothetical protein CDAR_67001 [Caerostris darwini]|uniref:Uncharacterized protein n=1 Tax=Caerostris darwini TaxID=1538125 RepID=A0AAV4QVL4_9ARAC|nr:hypothetical protein CDAR_67001 [Caerostris darwini]